MASFLSDPASTSTACASPDAVEETVDAEQDPFVSAGNKRKGAGIVYSLGAEKEAGREDWRTQRQATASQALTREHSLRHGKAKTVRTARLDCRVLA
jgi:hypothetical protein